MKNFFEKYGVELIIVTFVLGFMAIAATAVILSKPTVTHDVQLENKIYNNCVRKARLDIDEMRRLQWIDRCGELARDLSTTKN